jgi:hypothetical protein
MIGSLYGAAAEAAGDGPLSAAEWTALRAFTRAGAAMELLGALAEWHAGNPEPGDRLPDRPRPGRAALLPHSVTLGQVSGLLPAATEGCG